MTGTKVVALAGGSGSSKLLRGLSRIGADLTVICNVGDNFWFHSLYVCPDVDISTYALAGTLDEAKGWGVAGDTVRFIEQLGALGGEAWFRLGDKDLATSILRTKMLKDGHRLTEIADEIRTRLGVRQRILPSSDDPVETKVRTTSGVMHLQEFWVREKGVPEVLGVDYEGASKAAQTMESEAALAEADRVVLCPANPISSIGPMLAIGGVAEALKSTKARVVAVSPMHGTSPFSGPAAKFMRGAGVRTDSVGVAKVYAGFLDCLVISASDTFLAGEIREMGIDVRTTDTAMSSHEDEVRVAREALEA